MARLTDKDALEDAVQGAINIMESHGISMITASVPLAIIKGAQTIDAIPVEWIRSKITGAKKDAGAVIHDGVLKELLFDWQKEQEAKNAAD